ncbi:MAG: hypothetical protein ACPGVB_00125 [Chitinophagales bacterium]
MISCNHSIKSQYFEWAASATNLQLSYTYPSKYTIVSNYSPTGDCKWSFFLKYGFNELFGITHDEEGNTVLLINVLESKKDENGQSIGIIPGVTYGETIYFFTKNNNTLSQNFFPIRL